MSSKFIVCYSGGESSARVAVETVKRYGKENVILLNHDISSGVEDNDIKRFKLEVADKLGIKITYANMEDWETKTPLKLSREKGTFRYGNGSAICTHLLKTKPFYEWLDKNYPVEKGQIRNDIKILYGFDIKEISRIQRRVGVMTAKGYKTDYPLAFWNNPINSIEVFGIKKPSTYNLFRHANCKGCLKAGKQQWYVTYCLYPEIFEEAKHTENEIGYSILKNEFLEDLESKFKLMKCKGITPTEKISSQSFWGMVRKELPNSDDNLPCECAL